MDRPAPTLRVFRLEGQSSQTLMFEPSFPLRRILSKGGNSDGEWSPTGLWYTIPLIANIPQVDQVRFGPKAIIVVLGMAFEWTESLLGHVNMLLGQMSNVTFTLAVESSASIAPSAAHGRGSRQRNQIIIHEKGTFGAQYHLSTRAQCLTDYWGSFSSQTELAPRYFHSLLRVQGVEQCSFFTPHAIRITVGRAFKLEEVHPSVLRILRRLFKNRRPTYVVHNSEERLLKRERGPIVMPQRIILDPHHAVRSDDRCTYHLTIPVARHEWSWKKKGSTGSWSKSAPLLTLLDKLRQIPNVCAVNITPPGSIHVHYLGGRKQKTTSATVDLLKKLFNDPASVEVAQIWSAGGDNWRFEEYQ